MDQVRGTLPKQSGKTDQLKFQLQQMGYEFAEETTEISFRRTGRLESVLAEIMPLVEEAGWNARQDLYLEETHPEKAARSIYEQGRILRIYPHH